MSELPLSILGRIDIVDCSKATWFFCGSTSIFVCIYSKSNRSAAIAEHVDTQSEIG